MTTPVRKIAVTVSLCLLSLTGLRAQTASITWGAYSNNGVGDAAGNPLALGDLVMIGSFGSLSNAQISSASLSTLESNFINYDSVASHIGDGTSTPGTWYEGSDTNSTDSLNIEGKVIYYWIFNGATIGASSEEGVFTGYGGTNSSQWVFPDDNATPNTAVNDIADVTTSGTSGIVIGSYGTGAETVGATSEPLYNLAPINVPEPSAGTFALLAGLGLIGMRFFLKRKQANLA